MKQGKKIQTTRKYFRRKFIRVILATIFLAFLPALLIFIYQNTLGRNEDNLPNAGKFLCPSRDDVDVSDFVESGGSAAIVDETLSVTPLGGEAVFDKNELTAEEWAEFLLNCDEISGYDFDVAFNQGEDSYWLVLKKPRAIDFSLTLHLNSSAPGFGFTLLTFLTFQSVYVIALVLFVILYSKKAAGRVTDSIEKVSEGAQKIENGEYDISFEEGETSELDKLGKSMMNLAGELGEKEMIRKEEEEKRMLLVSELSHDLKTPLASINGASEMLLAEGLDEERRKEYLQMIHDNSNRADSILQELFTYSKLGSAGYSMSLEKADICEFTRLVFAEYIPRLEESGYQYQMSVPEDEITLLMNKDMFRRVYDNLIENAVKYNEPGVKISVDITLEDNDVKIIFADNGVGIPRKYVDKIFNPFYRVDDPDKRRKNGSGLGLAIVKRIIELHGGDIRFAADDNAGCSYIITIPVKI